MSQEYHAGAEGIVTIDGTDYNVTKWSATEDVTEVDITTTANWDATDQFAYKDRQGVKRSLEGTIDFFWDKLNQPFPTLRAGKIVALVLTLPNSKNITMARAMVKNIPIDSGGMEGIFTLSGMSFGNKGKYTVPT